MHAMPPHATLEGGGTRGGLPPLPSPFYPLLSPTPMPFWGSRWVFELANHIFLLYS